MQSPEYQGGDLRRLIRKIATDLTPPKSIRGSMPNSDQQIDMTWAAIKSYILMGVPIIIVGSTALIRACR